MLTGITLHHALRDILQDGRVVLRDISDAVQLMQLAETFGESVILVQGEDQWMLVVKEPNT